MFMAFHTSWKLSILALTIVPPITYSYRAYAKWARKITRSIYCAYGEANSTATDAISNIRTVRGFSTEEHEAFRYSDSINTALGHGVRNAYVGASVTAFSTYLNLGTAVLILWYGGQLVCDEKGEVMSIGSLITFQLYWNMMNNAFIALGNVFNDLIRSSSAAERVFSLIDARPDVNPDDGEEVTRDCVKGHLQLRGIQFRYRSRPETLVLKGIDMDMPPGTTTALVGKSGGGKSTLVHLLMRFYEPTGGEIRLDGRSMTTLSSKSVRKCCGFVAQDTQLFSSTIVENLAYRIGRDYTRDEVVEACRAANAHEFILEMEEGYDTRVGEKGIMLSGGQKQRLAIARCFLRKPRMLFLDEATSALDAENEAIVQGALESLLSELNSTVVLIAHRLSTVINATQICVVHKGTIVERGSHDELVAAGGVYAQLVSRQLSRDASAVMDSKKDKTKPSSNLDSPGMCSQFAPGDRLVSGSSFARVCAQIFPLRKATEIDAFSSAPVESSIPSSWSRHQLVNYTLDSGFDRGDGASRYCRVSALQTAVHTPCEHASARRRQVGRVKARALRPGCAGVVGTQAKPKPLGLSCRGELGAGFRFASELKFFRGNERTSKVELAVADCACAAQPDRLGEKRCIHT